MARKVLLIEDEPHLRFTLKFNLEAEGYEVVEAENGLVGVEKYNTHKPFSAILMDVQMPEMDGFQVAETIRKTDGKTQILMLTARASDTDRVQGFKSGVDDYLTKPFNLQELLLRVKRMAERSEIIATSELPHQRKEKILWGELELDHTTLKLSYRDKDVDLTALEADCLRTFMENPGEVLTREFLLETVWGTKGNQETRTVDAFVMRLRKKLEVVCGEVVEISSIRGRGYIIKNV